jgi:hypothetical protein
VARQAGGAIARPAMEGHGWRIAFEAPDPGPHWVREASETAGPRWAPTVTFGTAESQVRRLSALRPWMAHQHGIGFEPLIRTAAAVLWPLPTRQASPSRRWPSSARLAAAQDHLAVALRHGCAAPHPPRFLVARCCLCHHPALLPLDDLRAGPQALVGRWRPSRSIGPVPSGQTRRDVLAQATQAFSMRSSLPRARRALANEAGGQPGRALPCA